MARSLGYIPATMDEREAYTNLSNALAIAEAACKQLAYMQQNQPPRGQMWVQLASLMGQARQNTHKLMHAAASSLILPVTH